MPQRGILFTKDIEDVAPSGAGYFSPSTDDYDKIKSIRTVTFKKNHKILIEQWQMQDEASAGRWMEIIIGHKKNPYTKPPKSVWQEGDKLYFVAATAAVDWFDHGKTLANTLSGKTESLRYILYEPLGSMERLDVLFPDKGVPVSPDKNWYRPDIPGAYYRYDRIQYGTEKEERGEFVVFRATATDRGKYNVPILLKGAFSYSWSSLVGMEKEEIIAHFGTDHTEVGDLLIYAVHNRALILNMENNRVTATKYIRTSRPIDETSEAVLVESNGI